MRKVVLSECKEFGRNLACGKEKSVCDGRNPRL